MNTTHIDMQSSRQSLERTARPARFEFDSPSQHDDRDDQIVIRLNGHFDGTIALPKTTQERVAWDSDAQEPARRAVSKRNSRSFTSRVTRQKSRRRELLGRQAKLDTSFTRHRGDVPHQVFPEHEMNGPSRKSWFSIGRSSMKFKGLGITKGTPQPGFSHRRVPSIDREPRTADSLAPAPGTATWNEISPWDRPIPIGITIPTDSVSDFSPYQGARQRSGSDTTLVTPSIIITPAMPSQSVWSPDTPYTESDYTPSVYSRNTFNPRTADHDVPPVPALPLGIKGPSGAPATANAAPDSPTHNRNDTLDSNETAFEEDNDDLQRKNRVMSSDTFFEEDETPLRERTIETSLAVDTSLVPTPRRSQGWWNVITTPFVTTPLTGTWPKGDRYDLRTPEVPTVPLEYSQSREAPPLSSADKWSAVEKSYADQTLPSKGRFPVVVSAPVSEGTASRHASPMTVASEISADTAQVHVAQKGTQQATTTTTTMPDRSVTSPQSAMSATPVVATAAMATVLMPRQVEEPSRPININIELQDRRPEVNVHLLNANSQPVTQQSHTSWPAPRLQGVGSNNSRSNSPSPNLPTFAPPPTFAHKGSHFSYDNGSRASSALSIPDLKRQKKHRKVFDMKTLLPCLKRKQQEKMDEKKKKKRGCIFWCCGCCLILVVLLAILIPIIVVFSRKKDETIKTTPITTQPGEGSTTPASEWLTLTNLPPIPTGVLTIAQPEAVEEESGCVAPTTLWSCTLPKELQESVKPNKPDQPNFKIEITFDNSSASTKTSKRAANAVSVGAFIRERFLGARSVPSPSPAPPSSADMVFLGKTTDGNSAPFDGEDTPLFASFQDPSATASRLAKRANDDPTNITAAIPAPMLNPDGTAAPANLLPLPSAQPLRLYNRGEDSEHYGFYTYYDRSIFLKQINGTNRGGNPADTDGGSTEEAATLRCTFSETRFLVQIWTRSQSSKPLLQSSTQSDSSTLQRPGTFPYPVTVTIDRHGGNAAKKNLYCYNMESDGTIKNDVSKRSFQFEDRAFGGNLVNGTQGRPNLTGPIDGGSGGCSCKYQNWLD